MRDIDNLCINCFDELTEGAICSHCGYDNDIVNESIYLPAKTILMDKYVVGAFFKHESDAVTYKGYDAQLDKVILIREFFPKGFASRLDDSNELHIRQKYIDDFAKYKKDFIKLWETLIKLQKLSAVVPVYDVFEANGTAYAIIESNESIPLREYLLRNENGYIPWKNARLMFMPVLTTIEALHSNGIIHGSITPDNLVLCRDGKVKLSPFSIQACGDIKSSLEFNATSGYTALEQYDNNHKICPATDIYAFSACIYRALVGTNPPDAPARETNDKLMIPNSIAETIPIHVIKALGNGLQIYPEKRIKTISDFREFIDAAPAVQAKSNNKNETKKSTNSYQNEVAKPEKKKKSNSSNIIIIILIILIIGAIGTGVYYVKNNLYTDGGEQTSQSEVKTYEVPNFINNGYTQEDIENSGSWNEQFTITYTYEYSTDVEEGIVFKQSVNAGETVDAGTAIVLTVSKGIQTETVPNVSGLTVEVATSQLEALGFKVSTVEIYNDGTHTPNTVKATSGSAPAADEVAAVGEEIVLQVYGEVQTTTTEPETTQQSTSAKVEIE
jgi:serine/threonine-protein kinase